MNKITRFDYALCSSVFKSLQERTCALVATSLVQLCAWMEQKVMFIHEINLTLGLFSSSFSSIICFLATSQFSSDGDYDTNS